MCMRRSDRSSCRPTSARGSREAESRWSFEASAGIAADDGPRHREDRAHRDVPEGGLHRLAGLPARDDRQGRGLHGRLVTILVRDAEAARKPGATTLGDRAGLPPDAAGTGDGDARDSPTAAGWGTAHGPPAPRPA